jgi:hypothetical protein
LSRYAFLRAFVLELAKLEILSLESFEMESIAGTSASTTVLKVDAPL